MLCGMHTNKAVITTAFCNTGCDNIQGTGRIIHFRTLLQQILMGNIKFALTILEHIVIYKRQGEVILYIVNTNKEQYYILLTGAVASAQVVNNNSEPRFYLHLLN